MSDTNAPTVVLKIGEGEQSFVIGLNTISCKKCNVSQGPFAVHVTLCVEHARRFTDIAEGVVPCI